MIAAVAENGVIAQDGDLPWRLPKDLARFQKVTRGHVVVMGRKTLDTLPGPLKDRINIVMTRDSGYARDGVVVVHGLDEAMAAAASHAKPDHDRVYVAGGGEIYRHAMEMADELDITRVHAAPEGAVTFPHIDEGVWDTEIGDQHPADDRHSSAFTFVMYRRG
jgi:dihydrofolate reductase